MGCDDDGGSGGDVPGGECKDQDAAFCADNANKCNKKNVKRKCPETCNVDCDDDSDDDGGSGGDGPGGECKNQDVAFCADNAGKCNKKNVKRKCPETCNVDCAARILAGAKMD